MAANKKRKYKSTNWVQEETQLGTSSSKEFKLHKLHGNSPDPIMVQLLVNGKELDIEVDTGAALSIISEANRAAVFPNDTLHPSNLILTTYTE